jgi:hypothetical protein
MTTGEGGHPAKEEALRRFSEPEVDHELHSVLERKKVHHPHLWETLHRVHFSHEAGPAQLEDWRRAPKGRPGPSSMTKPWASCAWGCSRLRGFQACAVCMGLAMVMLVML